LIRNPKSPAPTRFQNATPTKKVIGHLYFRIQGRPAASAGLKRLEADQHERDDFERAEAAPMAMIEVGVPLKYRWWNVPGIPAKRKSELDAITAAPA
jgi:hypothetical protein